MVKQIYLKLTLMAKEDLKVLRSEALMKRRKSHINRIIYTIIVLTVFALYILYLDLIKNTQYNYNLTYFMIAAGFSTIIGEALYKIRKLSAEISRRNNK